MRMPSGLIFLCTIFLTSASGPAALPPIDLSGTWKGDLELPRRVLPIVLHISKNATGYEGTMDSPAQGAAGIPVTNISLSGTAFRFSAPSIGGRYEGILNTDATEITGEWSQGRVTAPLNLHRESAGGGTGREGPREAVRRPQTPEAPFPYLEEDISFPSLDSDVTLSGTLTRPKGPGPFPAVVLISGSGPQDRDETIMGHKPFLVLADTLARRGVAVLRYDDRGVARSGGDYKTATTHDFARDAAGALKALRARAGIDRNRVAYLGHSEGGVAAILAHDGHEPANALVLLSTPVLPYPEFVLDQVRALTLAAGGTEETAAARVAAQKTIIDAALSGTTPEETRAAVEQALIGLGADPKVAKTQAASFGTPWMFSMLRLDPRPALRRVRVPVLGLWGGKDIQVDATKHEAAAKAALAGNPKVDLHVIAGLNHLLQPAQTGAIEEYAKIETTIAPAALEIIAAWMSGEPAGTASRP